MPRPSTRITPRRSAAIGAHSASAGKRSRSGGNAVAALPTPAREWRVGVTYALRCEDGMHPLIDALLESLASKHGLELVGSGFGLGRRDLSFVGSSKARAHGLAAEFRAVAEQLRELSDGVSDEVLEVEIHPES